MDILNEKIEGLVKKAEKSGMPYGILKKVYDRGMAAWKTGHRPGTTPQQWAFARVNSFVTKSSGTWGKADKDLADKVRGAKKEEIENPKKAKDIVGQVKEKLGKDADAGDYVKDFKKSDAPQFKGKSDKKIQKMAIAAYLDSKEEVEVKEGTWELPKTSKQKAGLKHAMKIPIKLGKEGQNARNVIGPFIGDDVLFDDLMDAGDKNPRGDARPIIKKAMKRLGIKEEVSEVQEVDNSLAAQATRLISQTAIREKKDPADIDVTATDLDRKAADKNIFVQLKRAQDMKGKTDVEFLDKKKQKVDIRVINKALDMFDKMKPNDKLKMQTAIGKSYRDLLKVVQRGKV